jgi:hypothetical protein
MQLRIIYSTSDETVQEVVGRLIQLGRDPSCEVPFDPMHFPKISGLHAEIEHTPTGTFLIHKSQSNKTLVNDSPIDGTVLLQVGDRIRLGYTGPTIQVLTLSMIEPIRNHVVTPCKIEPVRNHEETVEPDNNVSQSSKAHRGFRIQKRRQRGRRRIYFLVILNIVLLMLVLILVPAAVERVRKAQKQQELHR